MFRYGDCSSCTARACLSVPSKTASPVVLTKSASRTLSFSVSFADCFERKYKPPAMRAIKTTAARMTSFHGVFVVGAAGMTALEDAGAAVIAEAEAEAGTCVGDDCAGATGAGAEPAGAAACS